MTTTRLQTSTKYRVKEPSIFIPFLKALDETGYDGFLTVELGFDYTSSPDAAAYQSRQKVLALLKEAKEIYASPILS